MVLVEDDVWKDETARNKIRSPRKDELEMGSYRVDLPVLDSLGDPKFVPIRCKDVGKGVPKISWS